MDKQQIAHILEKEINTINNTLKRLQYVHSQTIDTHQAIDLHTAICELIVHKQKLENIVTNIVEDATHFNPTFDR